MKLLLEQEFFEEEERSGFLVSAEMKRVWAAELKVLEFVINVCEKYGIQYFADYGTLLGAVRHKGFVPWDDDIDIALKRADYMKLMSALKKEIKQPYKVNSCYFSNERRQPFCSIANYSHVPVPSDVIEQFFGCPYVVGVDVYALDYVPEDKESAELQTAMYTAVYDLAMRLDEIRLSGELEHYLLEVEEMCNISLKRDDTLRGQLWRLCDMIAAMFGEEESSILTFFPRRVQGDFDFGYPKEWYDSAVLMKFEGMNIAVPHSYHEVLTELYGDYMQPQRDTSSHNYPFFSVQKEYLEKINRKTEGEKLQ